MRGAHLPQAHAEHSLVGRWRDNQESNLDNRRLDALAERCDTITPLSQGGAGPQLLPEAPYAFSH